MYTGWNAPTGVYFCFIVQIKLNNIFISIIMIFCAYFLLISLIYSYIVYDKGYDSYIIKTRIALLKTCPAMNE